MAMTSVKTGAGESPNKLTCSLETNKIGTTVYIHPVSGGISFPL